MSYTVEKHAEEFVLIAKWESSPQGQMLSEQLRCTKSELKVLPNGLVVLEKNSIGLWDLHAPIIETDCHYVREHKKLIKLISNISEYYILDSHLLYQVVPVSGKSYWQCIPLAEDRFVTTVWNKHYEKLIYKRMEEIPKIYEAEVDFNREFNKIYKYDSHLCMLKSLDKNIVVVTGKAELDGVLPISINYFDGEMKYLSSKHFSISNGNKSHVYPFDGKFEPIFGPYKRVVDIGERLTYGLPKSIMPKEGWAGLNNQNKVEEIYFKIGNKDLPKERDIFIEFPVPADHVQIRKHDTSKKDCYVISVGYRCDTDTLGWQEIFDMEGIRLYIN